MSIDKNDDRRVESDTSRKSTGMGATANTGDAELAENSKENLDAKLDNAAEESFPGSDPVSVKITK